MSLNVLYEKKTQNLTVGSTALNPARRLQYRKPHLHRELELVLYYGGKTVAYCDSVRYDLQPGDVFLTFPNQIHRYLSYGREDYVILIVKPEMMPELEDVFRMSVPTSAVLHGVADLPQIRILGEVLSCFGQAPNVESPRSKPLLRGYLLALFSELLRRMPLTGVSVEDSDTLRSIVTYCVQNFTGELSLSVLEENLHLNRYYISHLFSERLGIRFNDYVNSLRVSEACRYLLNSSHGVTEISDLVGFNTLRTFNRAFRRQIGVTPSAYRRQNEERNPVDA